MAKWLAILGSRNSYQKDSDVPLWLADSSGGSTVLSQQYFTDVQNMHYGMRPNVAEAAVRGSVVSTQCSELRNPAVLGSYFGS